MIIARVDTNTRAIRIDLDDNLIMLLDNYDEVEIHETNYDRQSTLLKVIYTGKDTIHIYADKVYTY